MVAERHELAPVPFRDGIGRRQGQSLEIQKLSLLLNSKIQVRAGSQPGHAYEPDALALLHALPGTNQDAR